MKIKQITLADAKDVSELHVEKYYNIAEDTNEYEITIPLVLDMKFEELVREKRLLKLIKESFNQIKSVWDSWKKKLTALKSFRIELKYY